MKHNSRDFNAKNTDPERTPLNTEYCNEKIKDVYHELFDDALQRYNDKQKRADRKIENYYEKIRSGKQEKTFHEIIIQVGNCDNMNAKSLDGELAERILDEYYQDFQKRNPNLKVFSAHLHMDEATPHLHIDFVPFTTKSKRGLDTRVSLKQALANQGFVGNSKQETEWSLWVESEKEALSKVMERYGVEWEQKVFLQLQIVLHNLLIPYLVSLNYFYNIHLHYILFCLISFFQMMNVYLYFL